MQGSGQAQGTAVAVRTEKSPLDFPIAKQLPHVQTHIKVAEVKSNGQKGAAIKTPFEHLFQA